MVEVSHIELWDKCRQIIRDNIPLQQYDAWFKDATFYAYNDGKLWINVPSSYYMEQIEERYMNILSPTLKRVFGPDVQLVYHIYQVQNSEDTAVNVLSTNPSSTILNQRKATAANPFKAPVDDDIDSQLNARYTFDNYCVGESNKIAVAIGKSIVDNLNEYTYNPLFIFGETGVGKTHLIQAIGISIKEKAPSSRVLYLTARLFESQYRAAVANNNTESFHHFYQSIDTLIIDDIQDLKNKTGTQNIFFHIFNHLHQNNKRIILSSDCAPAQMDGFESRLSNRFKWGISVELNLPDLELRRNVLRRKAAQAGLEISEEVVEYIANTVTSSIRELEGVMVSLVTHAIVGNSDITVALAKKVVEQAVKINRKPINFEIITEKVCSFYNLDPDLLFTKTRKREISDARQVIMYLAKTIAKMSIVSIGHRIDRTHATVNYACNVIEERLAIDKQLQREIDQIKTSILA